jgi:ferritin-like metal-binding protein YciE
MKQAQVEELLYQALETELGGVQIYQSAIRCAVNDELRQEWQKYLEETENHVRIVTQVFEELGLDTDRETPGRAVVRFKGNSLLQSMEMAREAADPMTAQLVAAEAVVDPRPRTMPTGS